LGFKSFGLSVQGLQFKVEGAFGRTVGFSGYVVSSIGFGVSLGSSVQGLKFKEG